MARSIKTISSFNAGEFSPLLQNRVDLAKYQSACLSLNNSIASKYGPASRRPGTQVLSQAKIIGGNLRPVRFIPFNFSTTTNFCLEFGHNYIRFYSNRQAVLVGGNAYEISSPYSALGGIPLNQEVIFQLQFCQIEDIIYITHPDYPVYSLTSITNTNWVLAQTEFLIPPLLDENVTTTTITPSGTGGGITLTASGAIFDPLHVGSLWQIASILQSSVTEIALTGNGNSATVQVYGDYTLTTYGVWVGTVTLQRSDDGGTTWRNIMVVQSNSDANFNLPGTSATTGVYRIVMTNYGVPPTPGANTPRADLTVNTSFAYGLVQITGYTSPTSVSATVITSLNDTNPTVYWSEGAFSALRGYPAAVCAFQQRLWFGGTQFQPQRVWGSATGDFENFDRNDVTLAASSIAVDLAADRKGPIYWMATGIDLFVGLAGAEWVGTALDITKGISTANLQFKQHSENGSAQFVPAMPIGDSLVYCERRALGLMQMMFSIATSKYMSQKLTTLANHITKPGIVQMDVQKQFEEQKIIWAITADGRLIGLTYDLEQEVVAWHQHNTRIDKGDSFVSVGCVYGSAGSNCDDVYLATKRTINGVEKVFIEILSTTDWAESGNDPNTAMYCDFSQQFKNPSSSTITGLSYLNGETVVVVVNNMIAGRFVVSGGQVVIPSLASVEGDVFVTVGFDYQSDIEPVAIDSDERLGMTQAEKKAIAKVYPIFLNTLGGLVNVGNDDVPVPSVQSADLNATPAFINGQVEVPVNGPTTVQPKLVIKQLDPLPLTLLVLGVEYSRTQSS